MLATIIILRYDFFAANRKYLFDCFNLALLQIVGGDKLIIPFC